MRRPIGTFTILTFVACSSGTPSVDTPMVPAPDPDLPFSYADGEASYLHSSVQHIEQEISGQVMTSTSSLKIYLTARIDGFDASRTVTFTIDTIPEAEGPGYTTSEGRRFNGIEVEGVFSRDGRISDLRIGQEPSPIQSRISVLLTQFFPIIPEGGATAGARWIDTTSYDTDDGSTRISTTAVTTHRAGAWLEDGSGLPVTWQTDYTFTGEGLQLGQAFTLEGTGHRVGEHLLSIDGAFLRTTSTDSSEATVQLTSMGITVPIHQTGADTVQIIR